MYKNYSIEELKKEKNKLEEIYNKIKEEKISLDMSRGKPCKAQLDLSMDMMSILNKDSNLICEDGTDCRNYGVLGGIKEVKELLSSYMENDIDNILIFGNSSLNVMYDLVMMAWVFGIDGCKPWSKQEKIKFLCPVPGYDRHFAITEEFGIEMINIPMNSDGPDMNKVEKLVSEDEQIKGIWCVPKYSNPDGISYSDETVKRFADLKPKAKDFRIFWDNAYTIHHLYEEKEKQDYILEILTECKKKNHEDMVYKFGSTSKIVFPGSGIATLATSVKNKEEILKHLKIQTIGYDKVNELRHVRYFKDLDGIKAHMMEHAKILRPKFEKIYKKFDEEFKDIKFLSWTKPRGGYFVSFYAMKNTAKEIVKKCSEVGLKLTPAGSSYPYHIDPDDSNIRIAPSFPSLEELEKALEVFCVVVKLVSIETLIKEKNI